MLIVSSEVNNKEIRICNLNLSLQNKKKKSERISSQELIELLQLQRHQCYEYFRIVVSRKAHVLSI